MSEEKPTIASRLPSVMKLEPGDYWWCSCGKSLNQPFCDGAHKGSGFAPTKVVITESKNVAFCNCKHSKNGPTCDGSHVSLD